MLMRRVLGSRRVGAFLAALKRQVAQANSTDTQAIFSQVDETAIKTEGVVVHAVEERKQGSANSFSCPYPENCISPCDVSNTTCKMKQPCAVGATG